MNTVKEITSHPSDLLLDSIASCRRSLDKFNGVLESILDGAEADPGKRCTKCGEWRPFAEFTINRATTDGHQYYCKLCCADYQREYRQTKNGKDTLSVWNREKYQTDEFYRWQLKAHKAVGAAVRAGILPHVSKRNCADCGEQAIFYHHDSYEEVHWLDVTPFCYKCHAIWHSKWHPKEG